MPATIIARTSTAAAARAANFCTSSRMLKPAADSIQMGASTASASNASGTSWAWRNLSPKTRQYIKVFAATSAVTDAVILYEYPEFFGLKKASE